MCSEKYFKDNEHNSLHLVRECACIIICSWTVSVPQKKTSQISLSHPQRGSREGAPRHIKSSGCELHLFRALKKLIPLYRVSSLMFCFRTGTPQGWKKFKPRPYEKQPWYLLGVLNLAFQNFPQVPPYFLYGSSPLPKGKTARYSKKMMSTDRYAIICLRQMETTVY